MKALNAANGRRAVLPLVVAAVVCLVTPGCGAGNVPAGTCVVEAARPLPVPAWAPRQRELLAVNSRIAAEWGRVYLLPNGHANIEFLHGGGVQAPDDFFECIYKFPLLYALGAADPAWETFWTAWKGSLSQCTALGLFKNEMVKHLDWHHNGEHYEPFWLAALCAPDEAEYRRLALKFAGFYDGTNPKVPNYDPDKKIIRSMNSGGAGPVLDAKTTDWDSRGGTFWEHWLDCAHDGPVNLVTTCFGTNAFLLTGEEKYRRRTLEYIDAWRDRSRANGGIIPSIVKRDGKVPDEWWGGVMGWNFRYFGGLFQVNEGPIAAWGNALLMTGDQSYYDEMRKLADELWKQRRKDEKGRTAVPRLYNDDDGWHGTSAPGVYAAMLANIYLATMSEADLDRVIERREVQGMAGHAAWHEGGYEPQWIRFLIGQNPDWPAESLDTCIRRTKGQLAALKEMKDAGKTPPYDKTRQVGWAGPLVNQMTGGIMPLWHGQLHLARFRYFDPERKRPGISRDCAALVESMSDDAATLVLANTSKTDARTVLVQTGAYAEHQCVSVTPEGGKPTAVNGTLFAVKLPPASAQRFRVAMKRYANTPTCRLPWGK
jgi:hypothetical protein